MLHTEHFMYRTDQVMGVRGVVSVREAVRTPMKSYRGLFPGAFLCSCVSVQAVYGLKTGKGRKQVVPVEIRVVLRGRCRFKLFMLKFAIILTCL